MATEFFTQKFFMDLEEKIITAIQRGIDAVFEQLIFEGPSQSGEDEIQTKMENADLEDTQPRHGEIFVETFGESTQKQNNFISKLRRVRLGKRRRRNYKIIQKQLPENTDQNNFTRKKKFISQRLVQLRMRRWKDYKQQRYWVQKFQIEYN